MGLGGSEQLAAHDVSAAVVLRQQAQGVLDQFGVVLHAIDQLEYRIGVGGAEGGVAERDVDRPGQTGESAKPTPAGFSASSSRISV